MEYVRLLSKYDYADLRIESGNKTTITLKDEEIKLHSGNFFGMSVRILKDGAWGFASSNQHSTKVEELLRKAESLASLERSTSSVFEAPQVKKHIKTKQDSLAQEEKVASLIEAKKHMKENNIISTALSCSDSYVSSEFYNSEGSEIIQEYCYTYLSCLAVARDATTIQRGVESAASRNGFSALKPETACKKAAETAKRLITAKPPPKGRFTVVLDPEMTGVFSHEVVGHASEADSVASSESILAGKKGERIASELVNICDDPSAKYFGFYEYDDEGIRGEKTELIKEGILTNYLNSRETAVETASNPNGHARAEDVFHVPIVRMSNTFFLPGKDSKDDVLDVRSGLYLKGMLGGSVDIFTGGFMFKAEEAYRIRNGRIEELIRDVTITGNVLEVLKNIVAVGNDFGTNPGVCGKFGQSVSVEDGGPHIRVDNITVG